MLGLLTWLEGSALGEALRGSGVWTYGLLNLAHITGIKSHDIVTRALEILANLDHRGAVGADPLLGDGAGILLQIPDPLFRKWALAEGYDLPPPGEYAVAQCMMPRDDEARAFVTEQFEKFVAKEGQRLVGWREVPTTNDGLGQAVIEQMPQLCQAIITSWPTQYPASGALNKPRRSRTDCECTGLD